MVPPEFRRTFTIISGFISLLQALTWSLIPIYSIGVYKCIFPFPFLNNELTSTWELLFVTYFNGQCRNISNFLITAIPEPSSATYTWMIVYSLVSSIWIPCCILLIVAAIGRVRGLYGSYLYYPWIIVTAVLTVVDVFATALHVNDLLRSLTSDTYAQFITGNSKASWATLTQNGNQLTTYLPALYMTLFFCRGVILWILNIIMLTMIVKACNAVAMYKSRYQETENVTNNSETDNHRWFNVFYQGPDSPFVTERSRPDRQFERNSVREGIDSPFQNSIKDSEQENGLRMKEIGQKQTSNSRTDMNEVLESSQRRTGESLPTEEIIPRVSSRRSSLVRTNSFQDKGKVFDYLGRPSSFRNINNGRFSQSRSDHLPSAELRNQMPFSYFQPMDALPPKPFQRGYSTEDAPPVPVPDYTLHFNRNQAVSSPNNPGNKPRVMRKPTSEYFKFPPPLSRSISDLAQKRAQEQEQYFPRVQTGVKYVPPVRPNPMAYGVQVFPQNVQTPLTPQTPDSIISDSRMLTTENNRRNISQLY